MNSLTVYIDPLKSTHEKLNGEQLVIVFQVEDLMKSLSIQLDNLCQFLPQDRVQDFAKQDSGKLLENTEKAVASASGIDLSAKRKELIELQKQVNAQKTQLGKTGEALQYDNSKQKEAEEDRRGWR